MEWVFWLYVTVEDIANMLSISEDVVSDIYEYWKLRRIDSGYKPLLRDKWEVERCTVRRLQSSPAALLPVRLRNEATMRQNLERVFVFFFFFCERRCHYVGPSASCLFSLAPSALNQIWRGGGGSRTPEGESAVLISLKNPALSSELCRLEVPLLP